MDVAQYLLLKEGYLDVKVPPDSPERVLYKAWRRLWVSFTSYQPQGRGEPHLIVLLSRSPDDDHTKQVKASRDGLKLFRCRSGSRPLRTWAVASGNTLLLYFAAPCEEDSQEWMQEVRDGLWPPITQQTTPLAETFDVSLIDDEKSFSSGLLGVYGQLVKSSENVITIVHPHWHGTQIRWRLRDILDARLVRQTKKEGSTSGVFSLTLRSSNNTVILQFYSNNAKSALVWIKQLLSATKETPTVESTKETDTSSFTQQTTDEISASDSNNTIQQEIDIPKDTTTTLETDSATGSLPDEQQLSEHNFTNLPDAFLNASVSSIMFRDGLTSEDSSVDYTSQQSSDDEFSDDSSLEASMENLYEDWLDGGKESRSCTLRVDTDGEDDSCCETPPSVASSLDSLPLKSMEIDNPVKEITELTSQIVLSDSHQSHVPKPKLEDMDIVDGKHDNSDTSEAKPENLGIQDVKFDKPDISEIKFENLDTPDVKLSNPSIPETSTCNLSSLKTSTPLELQQMDQTLSTQSSNVVKEENQEVIKYQNSNIGSDTTLQSTTNHELDTQSSALKESEEGLVRIKHSYEHNDKNTDTDTNVSNINVLNESKQDLTQEKMVEENEVIHDLVHLNDLQELNKEIRTIEDSNSSPTQIEEDTPHSEHISNNQDSANEMDSENLNGQNTPSTLDELNAEQSSVKETEANLSENSQSDVESEQKLVIPDLTKSPVSSPVTSQMDVQEEDPDLIESQKTLVLNDQSYEKLKNFYGTVIEALEQAEAMPFVPFESSPAKHKKGMGKRKGHHVTADLFMESPEGRKKEKIRFKEKIVVDSSETDDPLSEVGPSEEANGSDVHDPHRKKKHKHKHLGKLWKSIKGSEHTQSKKNKRKGSAISLTSAVSQVSCEELKNSDNLEKQ